MLQIYNSSLFYLLLYFNYQMHHEYTTWKCYVIYQKLFTLTVTQVCNRNMLTWIKWNFRKKLWQDTMKTRKHLPVIKILKDEEILTASLQSSVGEREFYLPLHHAGPRRTIGCWAGLYSSICVPFANSAWCWETQIMTFVSHCCSCCCGGQTSVPHNHRDWLNVCISNLRGKKYLDLKIWKGRFFAVWYPHSVLKYTGPVGSLKIFFEHCILGRSTKCKQDWK